MKVTSVEIHASNSSNFITLSFKDPTHQNKFNVKDILGLDADEITPKFYSNSGVSNQKYYELGIRKRDVVVLISLNPNYAEGQSVSSLRDELYKLIASSRTGAVEIRFKNGEAVVAAITGFVTKYETVHFSQTPEVQMTVNCSDAMLKAIDEISVPVVGLDSQATVVTDDISTAPHGFRFGVKFTGNIADFSIQDLAAPTWAFEINLTGSPLVQFTPEDELHFSSEQNNRYLYLVRDLRIIHLVDRIIPTSVWPVLFPGANPFKTSLLVEWDYITHYPTYWGV